MSEYPTNRDGPADRTGHSARAAGANSGLDSGPPVTATRVRGAIRAGRTQAQRQDTSERVTDPRNGPQARQRRVPPATEAAASPGHPAGVDVGERGRARQRPEERAEGDEDPSAASGDEAPAEEVVPALPGKQGCSERSERNPPCVTTPYALLVWSHSDRPRALAAGGCGRGDLGKHSRISVLATGRRPATAARNGWSQGRYRCRVSPGWSGDALRPVSQEPDADGANPVFGFVAVSEPLGAQRLAGLHPWWRQGHTGRPSGPSQHGDTVPAASAAVPRWVSVSEQQAASAAVPTVRAGAVVSWVRCPRVSAPERVDGIGEGPTRTRNRSGPGTNRPRWPKATSTLAGSVKSRSFPRCSGGVSTARERRRCRPRQPPRAQACRSSSRQRRHGRAAARPQASPGRVTAPLDGLRSLAAVGFEG